MRPSLARVGRSLADARASLDRWLYDPVPAEHMLFCRFGLGMILFLAYAARWGLVEDLYGPSGYAGAEFRARFPELEDVGWYLHSRIDILSTVTSSEVIWGLYLALLAAALMFALGVHARAAGTLLLILHVLFLDRNPGATWGWATMVKPLLAYTILAARSGHLSIRDYWSRLRSRPPREIDWSGSAWPLRLMQVNLLCVFFVLWSRLDEGMWWAGQGLAQALVSRDWARFDIDWFPYLGWLEYAGVLALILECGAPIALCIGFLRRWWALGLIGMFAILVVTASVGWWDLMMMVVLCVFLPVEWLRRFLFRGMASFRVR